MREIQKKLNQKGLSLFKLSLTTVCILFGLVSLIVLLVRKERVNLSHCFAEMILVCLPAVIGVLMQFRMNILVYVFLHFYAVSPLLGEMYHLYHIFSWWDDLLHITGGLVFAFFGIFLYKFFNDHGQISLMSCAVFALCFSIAISSIWEIYEYTCDTFFRTDMQKDTLITAIDSYYLSDQMGEIGTLKEIETVTVNDTPLNVKGYIDIGLIDTMSDLICATFGSLIAVIGFLIDKDKHPIFEPLR